MKAERQGKGENSLLLHQLNEQIEDLKINQREMKGQVSPSYTY